MNSEQIFSHQPEQSRKMLNFTVLQRIDPYIDEILLDAGHVTIYDYNTDLTQMSRKDVDGALFVVKRNAQPRFQLIVMNRLNTENLVVDLSDKFEYEVRHPYLLYRNATQKVSGLMFYNSLECDKVANLFSSFESRILRASGMNLSKRQWRKRKRISGKEKVKSPLENVIVGVNFRASKHDYQNVKESVMNVGYDACSTGMPSQLLRASASAVSTSSHPPSLIPSQSPIMNVPSLPMSTPSAPPDQTVKESTMNIWSNASSTGVSGQSQQGSASVVPTSSHPSNVISSQPPIMKVLSLPMSTPSVPHDPNVEESTMNIGSNASSIEISGQLQQASESAVPTSSHPPILIPSQSPIMKVQSVPMSPPSAKHGQNMNESMSIGCNASSTGMSGHLHEASASAVAASSHPPSVIPLPSPVMKLPSLPMSTPSLPHALIVKEASVSAVPTSSHPPSAFPLQSPIMKVPSLPASTPSTSHYQNMEESAINTVDKESSTGMSGQLNQDSAWSFRTSFIPPSVIPWESLIMKVPSLPASTPSTPHYQNMEESDINIVDKASSTGMSGQLNQASALSVPTSFLPPSVIPWRSPIMKVPSLPMSTPPAPRNKNVKKASASAVPTSSHPPSVIPKQSPIIKVSSFPISTPSAPLFPDHDSSEAILSNRDHVMPSSLFIPASSPTVLPPPISSTSPTPAHPPLAMQHFFGAPLLQNFKPAPSLIPNPTAPNYIELTKQNVQEALVNLVQDSQFIDMVYQALQKAHKP